MQDEDETPMFAGGRPAFGSWRAQSKFLVRHTVRTTCGSKCNYCLGFLACMMVVFVAAVVLSVLSNAPVVFLRLAEAEVGEIDLVLTSAGWTGASLLNYSTVADVSLAPSLGTSFTFHSPRFRFSADVMPIHRCHPLAAAAVDAAVGTPAPSQWTYEPSLATAPLCTDDALEEIDPAKAPDSDGVVRIAPAKGCLQVLCSSEYTPLTVANVYAINSPREARMGLGRAYAYPPIPAGSVYVHKNMAAVLGVGVGDTLYLSVVVRAQRTTDALFRGIYDARVAAETDAYNAAVNATDAFGNATYTEQQLEEMYPFAVGDAKLPSQFRANVPVTVANILPSSLGKFEASDTTAVLVEYDTVMDGFARSLNVNATTLDALRGDIAGSTLNDYASEIDINLPAPRIDPYLSSDFDTIQKSVLQFTSKVVYAIGFNQVNADEPIVESLRATRFFALFLGLILNVILVILTGLACLLIYSLLMVNVETRTFEMGTMRMLGMTKAGVIQLFLLQAFSYALPAYIIGMGVSQLSFWLLAQYFESTTDVEISPWLSPVAIGVATGLGLGIPVISALSPIRKALGVSLVGALQVSRSKQQAVKITVDRAKDGAVSYPLVVTGTILAVFGFAIYYLLPLALLSFNLTLLLNIFFALLIGMLLGLALLALNVQSLLEKTVVLIFLRWWESSAVVSVVLKNLVAHRLRNRKTTLMYSVSLAVIVFISVSFSLQISTFVYSVRRSNGALMTVDSPPRDRLGELEQILDASPIVRSWAYSSVALADAKPLVDETKLANLGHLFNAETDIYAVSPNFYEVVLDGFLNVGTEREGYKREVLSYLLYTPDGSGRGLVPTTYKDTLDLRSLDDNYVLRSVFNTLDGEAEYFHVMRTLAFVDSSPVFRFSKFPSVGGLDQVVSFPTFRRLLDSIGGDAYNSVSMDDIPLDRVFLSISEETDDGALDHLLFQLRNFAVTDLRTEIEALAAAEQVLSYLFVFCISVSMAIAYFSLTSSMASNIHEASVEIAILRALGASRWVVNRVFVYEAFVLAFSSALSGWLVGLVVATTMTLQQRLFQQLPVPLVIPWLLLVVLVPLSACSAFMASFWPMRRLLKKPIVGVLRAQH